MLNLNYPERVQVLTMLPEDMKHLINYDEKVAWIVQGSETVVVSDQRIILRKSGGLRLKKSFVDYPYSNMVNIKLDLRCAQGERRDSNAVRRSKHKESENLSKRADAYQLHRILRENIIRTSAAQPGQPFPVIIENQRAPKNRGMKMSAQSVDAEYLLTSHSAHSAEMR